MKYDEICRSIVHRGEDIALMQNRYVTDRSSMQRIHHIEKEVARLRSCAEHIQRLSVLDQTLTPQGIDLIRSVPAEMRKVSDEEISLLCGGPAGRWATSVYNSRRTAFPEGATFASDHEAAIRKQTRNLEFALAERRGGTEPTAIQQQLFEARRESQGMRFFCELFLRRLPDHTTLSAIDADQCDPVSLTAEYLLRGHNQWNATMRETFGIAHLSAEVSGQQSDIHGALAALQEALRQRQRSRGWDPNAATAPSLPLLAAQQDPPIQKPSEAALEAAQRRQGGGGAGGPPMSSLRYIFALQRAGRGYLTRTTMLHYFLRTVNNSDRAHLTKVREFAVTYLAARREISRVEEALRTEDERFQTQWRQWERSMTQHMLHGMPMEAEWVQQQDRETNQTVFLNLRTGKIQKEHPNILKVVATKNRQWAKAQKQKTDRRAMLEQRLDNLNDMMDITIPRMEEGLV